MKIHCRQCGSRIRFDEYRCRRCGRRNGSHPAILLPKLVAIALGVMAVWGFIYYGFIRVDEPPGELKPIPGEAPAWKRFLPWFRDEPARDPKFNR